MNKVFFKSVAPKEIAKRRKRTKIIPFNQHVVDQLNEERREETGKQEYQRKEHIDEEGKKYSKRDTRVINGDQDSNKEDNLNGKQEKVNEEIQHGETVKGNQIDVTHVSDTMQSIEKMNMKIGDKEEEVEEGEIHFPSLPSEIKNAKSIEHFVELNCERKEEDIQGMECDSMESITKNNNGNKNISSTSLSVSNEMRGRKKTRKVGRMKTVSEDPTEYRDRRSENLHDTTQPRKKQLHRQ
ncbi:hypothetical protein K7X08_020121 [Anisodus acutangulus]|uniref:Uncharacterized protein n=1 Tax=Anisodus acutangulus TaxID=402998 RepID=A0A9Q1RF32_9SOLA|nr:hypothetical protein K7X08_020121 [Anisodus acutangulus]